MMYGLMVREFGPKADESVYGTLVTQVHDGCTQRGSGPEFVWTALRERDCRASGMLVTGVSRLVAHVVSRRSSRS